MPSFPTKTLNRVMKILIEFVLYECNQIAHAKQATLPDFMFELLVYSHMTYVL
jgi:hypothetical protein